jgi:hypothetical protein
LFAIPSHLVPEEADHDAGEVELSVEKDVDDELIKEGKPVLPIVPSYEGYLFTVLDPIRPGETVSWIRTRRSAMPLSSQELYDKAMAYKRESGLGASGQFQALGPNQRDIVNRLVAEKNAAEKEANAVWTLFGVRRNYKEQKTLLKTWRINDAIRVTLRRGDKTKDVASDLPRSQIPFEDKTVIVDLSQPAVKKEKEKEEKKDPAPKKKKKQQAANVVPEYFNDEQYGAPYPQNDYVDNVEDYPPYENPQPQKHAQWPQQPQQQHPDLFQQQHPDPFSTYDMHGALPPEDAIPLPPQHQQYHQDNPSQVDLHIFPQPQPAFDPFQVDERQPRNLVAHSEQPISARRPSQSRQRSLSRPRSLSYHCESVDSERRRAEDERKIAAGDKVLNHWHNRSVSGLAGSSSGSTATEDFCSRLARLTTVASATAAHPAPHLTEASATTRSESDPQATSPAATRRAPGRTMTTASATTWRGTGIPSSNRTTRTASTVENPGTCATAGRATTTTHLRTNDVRRESACMTSLECREG